MYFIINYKMQNAKEENKNEQQSSNNLKYIIIFLQNR